MPSYDLVNFHFHWTVKGQKCHSNDTFLRSSTLCYMFHLYVGALGPQLLVCSSTKASQKWQSLTRQQQRYAYVRSSSNACHACVRPHGAVAPRQRRGNIHRLSTCSSSYVAFATEAGSRRKKLCPKLVHRFYDTLMRMKKKSVPEKINFKYLSTLNALFSIDQVLLRTFNAQNFFTQR